jgi:methylaspartate mutase epsilon subunit
VDGARVRDERDWILSEVDDIVGPVLGRAGNTVPAIVDAFAAGTLDIPFSASRQAKSAVVPKRDPEGAIRYLSAGLLPLSKRHRHRHRDLLRDAAGSGNQVGTLLAWLGADINYFPGLFGEESRDTLGPRASNPEVARH